MIVQFDSASWMLTVPLGLMMTLSAFTVAPFLMLSVPWPPPPT